tara:strand:- start:178 stop:483 length:306 start_codon:yes stop_codon:yes gene_type:complete
MFNFKAKFGAFLILAGIVLCMYVFVEGTTGIISFVRRKLLGEIVRGVGRKEFEEKVMGFLMGFTCGSIVLYVWYGFSTFFFGNYLEDTLLDRLLFGILGYW